MLVQIYSSVGFFFLASRRKYLREREKMSEKVFFFFVSWKKKSSHSSWVFNEQVTRLLFKDIPITLSIITWKNSSTLNIDTHPPVVKIMWYRFLLIIGKRNEHFQMKDLHRKTDFSSSYFHHCYRQSSRLLSHCS